jgi:hypothetical protein
MKVDPLELNPAELNPKSEGPPSRTNRRLRCVTSLCYITTIRAIRTPG